MICKKVLIAFAGVASAACSHEQQNEKTRNAIILPIENKVCIKNFDEAKNTIKENLKNNHVIADISLDSDTLEIAASSGYFDYPMGKYQNIASFVRAHDFKIDSVNDIDGDTIYSLSNKNLTGKCFLDSETKVVEIVSASINEAVLINEKITNTNNNKNTNSLSNVLMSLTGLPTCSSKKLNIKNIKLISSLDKVTTYYYSHNNKITSIEIKTIYKF